MNTLWDEIHQQPAALRWMIEHGAENLARIGADLADRPFDHVVVAARGTSDNAARYAQYVWGWRGRMTVALAAPSLFTIYRTPPRLDGALVVGISQSGRSPDLVGVLEEARRQGRPTMAITNDPDSPLALVSDHVVPLLVGEERAVAATKSYTGQLAAVALIAAALWGGEDLDDLSVIPEAVEQVLASSGRIEDVARRMADIDQGVVIGRGFNHATAFEWALKLQELAYLPLQPYSTADFLHGPIALVEPGFAVLAVAPSGQVHESVHQVLETVVERGARLVVIGDHPDTLALTPDAIRLPAGIPEWLSPIPAMVAAQLFTYHLAVAKGIDPDRPRGLSKVTMTR